MRDDARAAGLGGYELEARLLLARLAKDTRALAEIESDASARGLVRIARAARAN